MLKTARATFHKNMNDYRKKNSKMNYFKDFIFHSSLTIVIILVWFHLVNGLSKSNNSTKLNMNVQFINWLECDKFCKRIRFSRYQIPQLCNIFLKKGGCRRDLFINYNQNNSSNQNDVSKVENNLINRMPNKNKINSKYTLKEYKYLKNVYSSLNYILFSSWSKWSNCKLNTCLKYRFSFCKLPRICGDLILQETKLCLIECSQNTKNKIHSLIPNVLKLYQNNFKIRPKNKVKYKFQTWSHKYCGIIPNQNEEFILKKTNTTNKLEKYLKIIGGTESIANYWPWQLAIFNRFNKPFCGATLLNKQFAITAAHCIRGKLFIQAGNHDISTRNNETNSQRLYVAKTFIHPDFDPQKVDNDIALIKFSHPLKLSSKIWPICLPNQSNLNNLFDSSETDQFVEIKGIILGWGKRYFNEKFGVEFLHEAKVPLVRSDKCKKVYSDLITPNMFCAGYDQGKIDSCAGDSGGPLLLQGQLQKNSYIEFRPNHWNNRNKKGKRWYLYGVTSFGEGCGEQGKYGIYAKVANFVHWIQFTIDRNS